MSDSHVAEYKSVLKCFLFLQNQAEDLLLDHSGEYIYRLITKKLDRPRKQRHVKGAYCLCQYVEHRVYKIIVWRRLTSLYCGLTLQGGHVTKADKFILWSYITMWSCDWHVYTVVLHYKVVMWWRQTGVYCDLTLQCGYVTDKFILWSYIIMWSCDKGMQVYTVVLHSNVIIIQILTCLYCGLTLQCGHVTKADKFILWSYMTRWSCDWHVYTVVLHYKWSCDKGRQVYTVVLHYNVVMWQRQTSLYCDLTLPGGHVTKADMFILWSYITRWSCDEGWQVYTVVLHYKVIMWQRQTSLYCGLTCRQNITVTGCWFSKASFSNGWISKVIL